MRISTTAGRTGTEGTGPGTDRGDWLEGKKGRFRASGTACDRETPPLSLLRPIPSSASHRVIPQHNTDTRNSPPLDLTPTELAIVQAAIETEIYTIRKASRADFEHSQRAIVRQCLALDFLTVDQRARLAKCTLPTKQERISELAELQHFLASQ